MSSAPASIARSNSSSSASWQLLYDQVTLLVEHPTYRSGLRQVAAVLGKDVTNLGTVRLRLSVTDSNHSSDAAGP
jgi:hypothetical protein